MNTEEKNAIQGYVSNIREQLARIETVLNATTPTPPPVNSHKFVITDVKAVVRQIKEVNKAGRPIMEIYPNGDKTPPDERLVYHQDQVIDVLPEVIIGDGGYKYYEIVHPMSNSKRIFVEAIRGHLV